MASPKFTKDKKAEFLELFVENNFHLTRTCEEIGISVTSYYNAMLNDDAFKQKVDLYKDIAKTLIDNALLKGVNDVDPLVSVKFLDLIGKHKSFQTIFKIENKDENDTLLFELKKSDLVD